MKEKKSRSWGTVEYRVDGSRVRVSNVEMKGKEGRYGTGQIASLA